MIGNTITSNSWNGTCLILSTARQPSVSTADAELALVSWKEQPLLQADRPTTNFGFLRAAPAQERDAAAWLEQGDNRWVLLQHDNLAPCFDPGRARYMGRWHARPRG